MEVVANKEPPNGQYLIAMPIWIREFLAEFLGVFLQLYLLMSAMILYYIEPTIARRLHSDPIVCIDPDIVTNTTTSGRYCSDSAEGRIHGRMKDDFQYKIHLDAVFIIIIAFSWSAGMIAGLFISTPISGGFLNPAISLTLATMNRLKWRKLLYYIPAHYLASFFTALVIHVVYYNHINNEAADPERREIIIRFLMVPTPHKKINMLYSIADSFLSSAIFSMFVFAILDVRSNGVPKCMRPLLLAFTLIGLIMAFFVNTNGLQLSPARDLGTRVYGSLLIGFEKAFGSYNYCFWWLPQQVVYYIGYLAGGWFYVFAFGPKWDYRISSGIEDEEVSDKKPKEVQGVINQSAEEFKPVAVESVPQPEVK